MYGLVYRISCSETTQSYIGKTRKTIDERWKNHQRDFKRFQTYVHTPGTKKRGFCTYLYRAMSKYGFETFAIEQIGTASSKEELDKLETELIKEHGTIAPNGFNLTTGGDGGWEHSPEIKEKMRLNTIEGIRNNIDKLRKNEKSKGLPVHVIWTILKGCEAYLIQKHPLCSQKEFKFKDYDDDGEKAKQACLTFLANIVKSGVKYEHPKAGNISIKGIRKINGGFQVKKMNKGIRYVKNFKDNDKTDDENLNDAKKHLDDLISSWK